MNQDEAIIKVCIEKMTQSLPVLRKINNLTQKRLGEIIGVSRQTITNIESGKSEMQPTVFWALMFIFSLDSASSDYIKQLDFPNEEIRKWLIGFKER